jgi:hypothetical protein
VTLCTGRCNARCALPSPLRSRSGGIRCLNSGRPDRRAPGARRDESPRPSLRSIRRNRGALTPHSVGNTDTERAATTDDDLRRERFNASTGGVNTAGRTIEAVVVKRRLRHHVWAIDPRLNPDVEHLWSRAVATTGNRSQVGRGPKRAQIAENRCRRLRPVAARSAW